MTEDKWSNDWRWKIHSNSTILYNGWSPRRGLVAHYLDTRHYYIRYYPDTTTVLDLTWLDLTWHDLTWLDWYHICGRFYSRGMGLAFYLEFTPLSKNDKNFPKIGEFPFLTSNLLYYHKFDPMVATILARRRAIMWPSMMGQSIPVPNSRGLPVYKGKKSLVREHPFYIRASSSAVVENSTSWQNTADSQDNNLTL